MIKEQIVSQDPRVMHGTLVFAGTRVPVESLIQHLVAGDSLDVFLDAVAEIHRFFGATDNVILVCIDGASGSKTSHAFALLIQSLRNFFVSQYAYRVPPVMFQNLAHSTKSRDCGIQQSTNCSRL